MEIGAFEAKNKLAMLLDRVEDGEEITITRHGKPVARLVPNSSAIDTPKRGPHLVVSGQGPLIRQTGTPGDLESCSR